MNPRYLNIECIVLDADNCIHLVPGDEKDDPRAGTGSEELKNQTWYEIFSGEPADEVAKTFHIAHEAIKNGRGDRKDVARTFLERFGHPNDANIDAGIERVCGEFSTILHRLILELGVPDNVRGALCIMGAQYPMFVNTATPTEYSRALFEELGLTPLFRDILGRPKSKEQNLLAAIAAANTSPSRTLVVDDTLTHLDMADRNGCHAVGIRTHRTQAAWAENPPPYTLINSLAELPKLLGLDT